MWLPVISTARISSVSASMPRCILRQTRRLEPLCLRACALGLDGGAVDQQAQRALRPTIGDVDGHSFLTATECAEVGHRPIEANKLQQALNITGRLPKRHAEQNLHRQARLWMAVSL